MRSRSLVRQLLPPLAVAVAAITLVVLLVGSFVVRWAVLDRAHLRAQGISASSRHTFERIMRSEPHEDLQGFARDVARNPDVEAVRIIQPDFRVHASSLPSEVGRDAGAHGRQVERGGDLIAPTLTGEGNSRPVVHLIEPLRNARSCQRCHGPEQPILGFLDTDVAVNPHTTGLATLETLGIALGLFYVVAVAGVATPLIHRVVGRPVRRLIDSMERVQAGDFSVHVKPFGTTEIDQVTLGFNKMVEQLRRGRAAEEESRRLQLERVEQLAVVGELAAGLAHEIRNPLSGVKTVLEAVAEESVPDNPSRRAILRDASAELLRIDQIVRDLLEYARPKPPELTTFDLNDVARETVAFTTAKAVAAGAKVTTQLAPDLPAAFGDPAMVRQVLVNLLLNALQAAASPEAAEIQLATWAADRFIWCRVRDNGPGVPAERAESIFRPFVTTRTRGTGLGLAISQRVVQLQGGRLTLDNPGHPGASFSFTVPVAGAPGAAGQASWFSHAS